MDTSVGRDLNHGSSRYNIRPNSYGTEGSIPIYQDNNPTIVSLHGAGRKDA